MGAGDQSHSVGDYIRPKRKLATSLVVANHEPAAVKGIQPEDRKQLCAEPSNAVRSNIVAVRERAGDGFIALPFQLPLSVLPWMTGVRQI